MKTKKGFPFLLKLKIKKIINQNDIDDVFQSIYTTIVSNVKKSLANGSGWITDSFIDHTTSISKCDSLARISYVKLPKELSHPRKGWINVQILMIMNALNGV